MKSLLRLLTGVLLSAVCTAVVAETDISFEEHFGKLPKSVKKALGSAPIGVEPCRYSGRRIALKDASQKLWFATNSCQGSAGGQISLVLESKDGATQVLYESPMLGIKIHDKYAHGMPTATVYGAANCCGEYEHNYQFNGKEYTMVSDSWTGDIFQNSDFENPSQEVVSAIPKKKVKKDCKLKSKEAGLSNIQNQKTSFAIFSCDNDTSLEGPLRVVLNSPSPRIILEIPEPFVDNGSWTIGPGRFHGLQDICLEDDSEKENYCWRYNGNNYVPSPEAVQVANRNPDVQARQEAVRVAEEQSKVREEAARGPQWAESDNGADIKWAEAKNYCASKGSGWRLPTISELGSYHHSGHSTPCGSVDGTQFTCKVSSNSHLTGPWFWSHDPNDSYAWAVNLAYDKDGTLMEGRGAARALCVRQP